MPPTGLRALSRAALSPGKRALHTTPNRPASILFALASLSNSRETQHFNKITRLPRTEHSPNLKLIQTSEIQPFPIPLPAGTPAPALPSPTTGAAGLSVEAERDALALGRTLLAEHARQRRRWIVALQKAERRESAASLRAGLERDTLQSEVRKLRSELRDAAVLVVAIVAAATGVAVWQFWPAKEVLGTATALKGVEKGTQTGTVIGRGGVEPVVVVAPAAVEAASASVGVDAAVPAVLAGENGQGASWGRWWKGWFWKQG